MSCRGFLLMILLAAVIVAGCDEAPRYEVMEPPPAEAPEEVEAPAPLTAEEIEQSPWQRMRLGPLPVTAEAPLGWEITRLGEVVLLEGRMPSGDVQIQLASRPVLSQTQLERLIEGAEREQREDPTVVHVELREQADLRILEKRSIATLQLRPLADEGAAAEAIEMMDWRINVLIPAGEQFFENHELNFLALRRAHFEADQALLERIMRSIRRE